MAPEVIAQKQYDSSADIWSLGITALELCTGRAPYSRDDPARVLQKVLHNDAPTLDRKGGQHKYSQDFKEIVESCLVKDPTKRPTAAQLLETPFFQGAKRKSYLVHTLISGLPPLADRQERRAQPSIASTPSADSWDFASTINLTPTTSPTVSLYSKSASPLRAQSRGTTLPPLGVFDMDEDDMEGRSEVPLHDPTIAPTPVSSTVDTFPRIESLSDDLTPDNSESKPDASVVVSQSVSSTSSSSNAAAPITPPSVAMSSSADSRSKSGSGGGGVSGLSMWKKLAGKIKETKEDNSVAKEHKSDKQRRGSFVNMILEPYAPQLGDALHITHTQLNMIGLAGNTGFFLLLFGYGGIKYFYDQSTSLGLLGFSTLALASFATGVGGNSGLTAAMNTTAKSFPDRMRATTTSIVASGYGLSAFFFSTLAHVFFPGNTSGLLLVLAIGTSVPMLIGLVLVKVVPHAEWVAIPSSTQPRHSIEVVPERDERRQSQTWEVYSTVVGQGGYERLTESDLEDEILEASASAPFLPQNRRSGEEARSPDGARELELSPSRRPSAALADLQANIRRHSRSRSRNMAHHHESADIHGWGLLKATEFWILFSIMCCLAGTGLMYINNVGSMAQALFARGDPKFDTVESAQWQAAQVSITSVANCLGRVLFGSSADVVKHHYEWRRSYFIVGVSFTFIVSQLALYNVESVQTLWIASALLGLGYGGMFGLFPTIMIEWFGLAHFSQNWGFLCLSPVIAGNLFSLAFGRNLDAHSRPLEDVGEMWTRGGLPSNDSSRQCLEGRFCYLDSIKITIFACIVAFALSIFGALRDRQKHQPRREAVAYAPVSDDA
ncbi:hypothetical protein FRC17_003571 [Serendipita sp. 399]|nr:hypothetical protein FRC17_003571 [Serendipita sp. 399]